MTNLFEEVQAKASQLSHEERAALALRLIESLDANKTTSTEEWQTAWLAECEQRLERYESGKDRRVSLADTLHRARSQLK